MEMELLDNGSVRCFIGQADLDKHNITMLDFVIHPESSRPMLQEYIELARNRYGFRCAGSTVIEAVPLSKDRLVLTFSNGKVPSLTDWLRDSLQGLTDDAEQDSEDAEDMRAEDEGEPEDLTYADTSYGRRGAGKLPPFLQRRSNTPKAEEIFGTARMLMSGNDIMGDADGETPATSSEDNEVVICFRKLDNLMSFAKVTGSLRLSSTLFYGAIDRCYVLWLDADNSDPADLLYAGRIADEYGTRLFDYSLPYYREYFRCIAEDDALEKLRSVQ